MKCLICGRLSLPGAKLCLDCKAARKRAFDATVTQPLLAAAGAARNSRATPKLLKPSQSVPDAARRAAKMALAAQAQSKIASEAAVEPASRRVGRWPIAAGATLLVLAVVAYFGHWFGAGKSDTFAAVPDRPALESPAEASVVRTTAPVTIAAAAGAASVVPVVSDGSAAEPSPATKPEPVKRANPRPRAEKAPVVVPTPEPPPPEVVAVAPPPPPPVVREAPRVDPFQVMMDAIARCPRNDISGRATCEQRLRSQYCEGHWGQVPQCASIPYVDHGQ